MFNPEKIGPDNPQEKESLPPQEEFPQPPIAEKQETPKLRLGDSVNIRRSSGEVEPGWVISGFDESTGDVAVKKIDGSDVFRKKVTQLELEELNQPERKMGIHEAKSFDELLKAVEATGGLQGSGKFYEVAELQQIINQVRSGESPIDNVTRAGGLRQRVTDLLQLEELHKNIEGTAQ